jgi:hypothetical protein
MTTLIDREIDALVAAQVMGWGRVTPYLPPKTDGGSSAQPFGDPVPGVRDNRTIVPNYSTNIADAWKVVEHLRSTGLRSVITPDWHKSWSVAVYRREELVYQSYWFDTAPLAICHAALAVNANV